MLRPAYTSTKGTKKNTVHIEKLGINLNGLLCGDNYQRVQCPGVSRSSIQDPRVPNMSNQVQFDPVSGNTKRYIFDLGFNFWGAYDTRLEI